MKFFTRLTLWVGTTALYLNPLSGVFAQDPTDALRWSWTQPNGTARQLAVGGAMGSLGGDISATFVNPAGLAFFRTGDLVLSPAFQQIRQESDFLNRKEKATRKQLSFGTSGLVLADAQTNRRGKKQVSVLSLALNRTAHFRNDILYRGLNTKSSYSQKYLEEIQGIRDANVVANQFPHGSSLAFNTYWIDTVGGGTNGNFQFKTRAPIASGLLQENWIRQSGGITELAFALAGATDEKLYYGATVGIPFLSYEREGQFTEADAGTALNNFDFAQVTDYLETKGVGVNIKLGVLYRPNLYWRLGLAFHTPTWFSMKDTYRTVITTNTERYKGEQSQSSALFNNGAPDEFQYIMSTPYRAIASASYVLRSTNDIRKQKGFLTADVEYVNHRAVQYSPDTEADNPTSTKIYLKALNQAIDQAYQGVFNFRFGGELKFNTWMVRAGAALLGNPYVDLYGEKGSKTQLSGGLGYRDRGVYIDLTYVHLAGKDIHTPYRLASGNFPMAQLRQQGAQVVLTVGMKLGS
ncbi:MAG: aromatic hydrocarbon degradation protein [Bacteroidetes bacterium]|nr:aromatic hydrocarbon degradation protein [Bacteroidota bacterium]